MKNIIVTGGAGFIGSNLCEELVKRGDNVICIDNLLTGSQKNIVHLLTKKNFYFFQHDVCKIYKSRKFKEFDEIYHLASPADPNIHSKFSYMNFPFETMKVNSIGTWNMCELALKHNSKLLFASTSEVYGDPEVSPQSENYRGSVSTIGPRSVYDESKRFGETIVSAYVRLKKLDGRIIRIFNTYGPRMNIEEGRAVVKFIKQSIKNEPITIYGDGRQTRSFCYITDQVSGIISSMEGSATRGEVFNIGNDVEITILEFAQQIKNLAKSQNKIIFTEPLPIDDPKQRRPDISKARKILKWEPAVDLEEGIIKTIEYFKSQI